MATHKNDVWYRVSQEIDHARGMTGEGKLLALDKALVELGMDSLKLIEIVYQLETFYQLDVDEELLAELESIGDLVHMFASALASRDGEAVPGN